MIGRFKLIVGCVVAFVFGCFMFYSWTQRLQVREAPIVSGKIIGQTPVRYWLMPRVDVAISLPESNAVVHAIVGKGMLKRLPGQVRFHYTGDPSREVYLFEYEENPLYIWLVCLSVPTLLAAVLYRRRKDDARDRIIPFNSPPPSAAMR